jgi:hypothetical protein
VVSCLEFQALPQHNACWSVLDGERPSIGLPALLALLESGPVTAVAEPVFVDNGDKTAMTRALRDRMLGEGRYLGDPAGIDRYPQIPGIDSWVVRLPVVECQDETLCAGGDPQQIVGALCFEVREIELGPVWEIRGRFLCPETDPDLFERCELGPAFVEP